MKMVFITYNVAVHDEILEMLRQNGVDTYTRWEHVTGVGESSGPHLGTHVWPALNSAIMAATSDDKAKSVLAAVREMRQAMSGEGVKAFIIPVEDVT
jgi:nitrogen regulatory protein PII